LFTFKWPSSWFCYFGLDLKNLVLFTSLILIGWKGRISGRSSPPQILFSLGLCRSRSPPRTTGLRAPHSGHSRLTHRFLMLHSCCCCCCWYIVTIRYYCCIRYTSLVLYGVLQLCLFWDCSRVKWRSQIYGIWLILTRNIQGARVWIGCRNCSRPAFNWTIRRHCYYILLTLSQYCCIRRRRTSLSGA